MDDVTLHPAGRGDPAELLDFEVENRSYFEAWLSPRPEGYYSLDAVRAALADLDSAWEAGESFCYLVRDAEGGLVGRVNLTGVDSGLGDAEIGYRIGERHTGRGHATAAIGLAVRDGFSVHGLRRIEALTMPSNIGSQLALVRNGFSFEGRLRAVLPLAGTWHDGLLFGVLAGDLAEPG